MANVKSMRQIKALIGPSAHLERTMGSPAENIAYCSKDGNFFEWGTRPMSNEDKGDAERDRWARTLALARANKIFDIEEPDIIIRNYGNLVRIAGMC
jgi:prolyl oligopeptidase PreP (S9A serine peptidase family)